MSPAGAVRTRTGSRRRVATVLAVLTLIAVAMLLIGVTAGSYPISPGDVWAVLSGAEHGLERTVVIEWRLPRTAAALTIGACLGLSGALLQTVTRNPLASPDLIGISGGAYTAVLLLVVVAGSGWAVIGPAALAGGLSTAAVVFVLSGSRTRAGGSRFLLAGVAVAALLGGVNSWIVRSASLDSVMSAAVWGAGSLAASTWSTALVATVTLALSGAYCALATRRTRVHALGDDVAASLGAAPGRLRVELLVVSVVLVSIATALCGPIGLLPLVAPPIARVVTRSGGPPFTASALVGAVLLALADLLAQHVLPGGPPAGLVTTVLGGGYLLLVLVRGR